MCVFNIAAFDPSAGRTMRDEGNMWNWANYWRNFHSEEIDVQECLFREDFVKHGSTLSGSCFLNIYKKLHISGNWFLNIYKKLQCLHSCCLSQLKAEQKACDVIVRVEESNSSPNYATFACSEAFHRWVTNKPINIEGSQRQSYGLNLINIRLKS